MRHTYFEVFKDSDNYLTFDWPAGVTPPAGLVATLTIAREPVAVEFHGIVTDTGVQFSVPAGAAGSLPEGLCPVQVQVGGADPADPSVRFVEGLALVLPGGPVAGPPTDPLHEFDLTVDLYGGSFVRVMPDARLDDKTPHWCGVVLATEPGPNGEVFADLAAMEAAGGVVWFDHGGSLGHVKTNTGADLAASMLARYIRENRTLEALLDLTDSAHPALNIITTHIP